VHAGAGEGRSVVGGWKHSTHYAELLPNAYGKERTAAEWVAWPNKETALMAILRWLLFHWSAMTWFLGMDTRLQLGRERFQRVV
jgi:hypothetical protein